MAISIRLEPALEHKLAAAATAEGVSKSEFVRRCIAKQLEAAQIDRAALAWELGKDIFGMYDSGRSDVSENHKQLLGEIFDEKHRRRRRL